MVKKEVQEKKCKICGNKALTSTRSGLCSKHAQQYNRQRKTDGRSLSEFVKFHTMSVEVEKNDHKKITEENAVEQRAYWQAVKEQESALRIQRENNVRAGMLVDKSEAMQETATIIRGIVQNIENNLDAWPVEFENKSAGEIKKIMVKKIEVLLHGCAEFLENV